MILNYNDVKEKPDTWRAMTSLNRDEFEILCKILGEVWNEKIGQAEQDSSKGGRNPILKSSEDRLFFILF